MKWLECGPRATCGAGSGDVETDNGVLDGGGSRVGGYWREGSLGGGGNLCGVGEFHDAIGRDLGNVMKSGGFGRRTRDDIRSGGQGSVRDGAGSGGGGGGSGAGL